MTFRFAIIGAGLTGTSMLYQLLQHLKKKAKSATVDPRRVHIRIFEKQATPGPGFPHNARFVRPYHITNMCAEEMSVSYLHQRDFADWVESQRASIESRFSELKTILQDDAYRRPGCSHYPRAIMGEYLSTRFADALHLADNLGTTVITHTGIEVTDILETPTGVRIQAEASASGSLHQYAADRALLATGHWPRDGSGRGYFASPWPAQRLLGEIPRGADVAVIGSSLSAIETALTLTSDGDFRRTAERKLVFNPSPRSRRVTLMSRHGILPKVRSPSVPYQASYFNLENLRQLLRHRPGRLSLDDIFHLLDRELEAATGGAFDWRGLMEPEGSAAENLQQELAHASDSNGMPKSLLWQSILRSAFPLIRELYLALSLSERDRFERDYATLFFAHAATQPAINAEKILALMQSGVVSLVKLGNRYKFVDKSSAVGYEFVYGRGKTITARFRYVVDARGQQRSVHTNKSCLMQNLIRKGMVQLYGERNPGIQRETRLNLPDSNPGTEPFTASVQIDPRSHRVLRSGKDGNVEKSRYLYAVGAMTRGQIIDVSMARGLTRSTNRIAEDLVDWLAGNQRGRPQRGHLNGE